MSQLKVNNIVPRDSDTLTLGNATTTVALTGIVIIRYKFQ